MSDQIVPPQPIEIAAVRDYFEKQREELKARVANIESVLGFIATSDELAVRVAKLENYVLPKG